MLVIDAAAVTAVGPNLSPQLCKPSRRNLWHSAAAAQLGLFLSACLLLGHAKNRTLEAVGSIPISSTARSLGIWEVAEAEAARL